MISKETDQAKAKVYVDELYKIKSLPFLIPQKNIILQGKVKPYDLQTNNAK